MGDLGTKNPRLRVRIEAALADGVNEVLLVGQDEDHAEHLQADDAARRIGFSQ